MAGSPNAFRSAVVSLVVRTARAAGAVTATDAAYEAEAQIVARAREGDGVAFERLVQRHGALVRALARRYVGPADAADAAQEIWLAAHAKLWQLGEDERFAGWLRTVAFYRSLNYRKARARRARGEVVLGPEDWVRLAECVADDREECVAEAVERRELRRHVSAELDRLPGDHGLLLRLRLLQGLSYREIAASAHLPVSTVRWRLHEGRVLLRARLAAALRQERGRVRG